MRNPRHHNGSYYIHTDSALRILGQQDGRMVIISAFPVETRVLSETLGSIGGYRGRLRCAPQVPRFFRFYILIICKVATLDFGAPPTGLAPPSGNHRSAIGQCLSKSQPHSTKV